MHPLGAAVLTVAGAPAAAAFTILHGAGNGILTIAKGTLPLVLFWGIRTGACARRSAWSARGIRCRSEFADLGSLGVRPLA